MRSAPLPSKRHKQALVLFAIVLLVGAGMYGVQEPASTLSNEQSGLQQETSKTGSQVVETQGSRPVYLHSVVPGGVANATELKQIVRRDRVVAQHYAGFDLTKAHNKTIQKPRMVYVSYRKGDNLYWTKNKVKLVPGETILSDGSLEARARCANRISDTPQFPVESKGPTEEELDTAEQGQVEHAVDSAVLPVVAENSAIRLFGVAAQAPAGGNYVAPNFGLNEMYSNTLSGTSSLSSSGRQPKPVSTTQADPIGSQSSYVKPAGQEETSANESQSTNSSPTPDSQEASSETSEGMPSQKPSEPTIGTTVPSTSKPTEPSVSEGKSNTIPSGTITAPSTGVETPRTRVEAPIEPSLLPTKELTKPVGFEASTSPKQTVPTVTVPQEATEVPEPSTIFLFGASLTAMLLNRGRKLHVRAGRVPTTDGKP